MAVAIYGRQSKAAWGVGCGLWAVGCGMAMGSRSLGVIHWKRCRYRVISAARQREGEGAWREGEEGAGGLVGFVRAARTPPD